MNSTNYREIAKYWWINGPYVARIDNHDWYTEYIVKLRNEPKIRIIFTQSSLTGKKVDQVRLYINKEERPLKNKQHDELVAKFILPIIQQSKGAHLLL